MIESLQVAAWHSSRSGKSTAGRRDRPTLELEIVAWSARRRREVSHGKHLPQGFTGKGFPMKRMTCLAMAAGLFTANDVKSWKAAGRPRDRHAKLVGRPIMIEC